MDFSLSHIGTLLQSAHGWMSIFSSAFVMIAIYSSWKKYNRRKMQKPRTESDRIKRKEVQKKKQLFNTHAT